MDTGKITPNSPVIINSYTQFPGNRTIFFDVSGLETRQVIYNFTVVAFGNGTLTLNFRGSPASVSSSGFPSFVYNPSGPWENVVFGGGGTFSLIIAYNLAGICGNPTNCPGGGGSNAPPPPVISSLPPVIVASTNFVIYYPLTYSILLVFGSILGYGLIPTYDRDRANLKRKLALFATGGLAVTGVNWVFANAFPSPPSFRIGPLSLHFFQDTPLPVTLFGLANSTVAFAILIGTIAGMALIGSVALASRD
jgi:hypothetical protein